MKYLLSNLLTACFFASIYSVEAQQLIRPSGCPAGFRSSETFTASANLRGMNEQLNGSTNMGLTVVLNAKPELQLSTQLVLSPFGEYPEYANNGLFAQTLAHLQAIFSIILSPENSPHFLKNAATATLYRVEDSEVISGPISCTSGCTLEADAGTRSRPASPQDNTTPQQVTNPWTAGFYEVRVEYNDGCRPAGFRIYLAESSQLP